ncbi:MAG: lysine exporter LysO family protein, partial [Phocaeicola sp.]|nr:lysine exporter LysO family protein [Phocaeicola sp.]
MCLGFLLRKQALCLSCWALCALMFCVGVSIGNDPQTLRNFRSLNPRLVFLPAMTILGTFA